MFLYNLYWFFIMLCICIIGIPGFYVYDSIAVLGPFLKDELNFTQVEIAWLYSCYYFPNIILSLFAGIIIDKWGERKCSCLFSLLTIFGQAIISLFPTIIPMSVGRFLLGIAAEGMFICQLKLFSTTFPNRISSVLSLSLAFNRLCTWLAYITLTPIAKINLYLALYTCTGICIFCFIINILYLYIEAKAATNSYLYPHCFEDLPSVATIKIWQGVKYCLKSFPLWCMIIVAFFYYGSFLSYASLSPIFIGEYYSLTITQSNFVVSLLSIGSIIGALIFGLLADKIEKRLLLIFIGLLFGLISFSILSITNKVNIIVLTVMLGISYGSVPCLLYSLIPISINKQYVGIATGLIEVANAWAVLIFPLIFGYLLEQNKGTLGISLFTILLTLCIISVIILFVYDLYYSEPLLTHDDGDNADNTYNEIY
jgi:MFS family permease